MYLLKDGKVIEEMRGHYDSYGRVFKDSTYDDSFEWSLEWGKVCDLMFTDNEGDGIATKGVLYPNLIEQADGWFYNESGPENCEHQGYFYDETDYDDEDEDSDDEDNY